MAGKPDVILQQMLLKISRLKISGQESLEQFKMSLINFPRAPLTPYGYVKDGSTLYSNMKNAVAKFLFLYHGLCRGSRIC